MEISVLDGNRCSGGRKYEICLYDYRRCNADLDASDGGINPWAVYFSTAEKGFPH
jgi:hypothetical protein